MPRYSLKQILIGITLASIGFAMLAIAFHNKVPPTTEAQMLGQAFLVAFGGSIAGWGLACIYTRWPPTMMTMGGIGMFAAQGWQSGSSVGLLVYIGLTAIIGCARFIESRRTKRELSDRHSPNEPPLPAHEIDVAD